MFGFSDFEERLLSDEGVSLVLSSRDRLLALRNRMESRLREGLSAADYETARTVIAATRAAEVILLDTTHLKGAQS